MTEQKTTGVVKAKRRDGKGVQLDNGSWYSGFNQLNCNKGDKVEITYKQNGNYNNIVKLTVVQQQSAQLNIREDVNASQLTSYAKDIVVAELARMPLEVKNDKNTIEVLMEEAAKAVAKAYKAIKQELDNKPEPVKEPKPTQEEEEVPYDVDDF